MKHGLFKNKYGHFSTDGKEYIITNPITPRPWVNVLSNKDYGVVVSQLGSGYSWKTHASLNRLTRWEQDLVRDDWGKYIYIRDNDSGQFWSAGYKPVSVKPDFYECCHGIGYTRIISQNQKIQTELTIFVPPKDSAEIWLLRIKNLSQQKRHLSIFTYLEWCLGEAPDSHREFHKIFIETDFHPDRDMITAQKRLWTIPNKKGQHWNMDWPYVGFHCSSQPVESFTCDKESFLGLYQGLQNPQALRQESLNGQMGKWNDSIASLHVHAVIDGLSENTVVFTLGLTSTKKQAESLSKKYRDPQSAFTELENVKKFWDPYLSTIHIDTPDPAMNLLTNVWYKYQAISGRIFGRTAYYQSGGAFGFRDQLQDSQIFLPIDPSLTRKQILLHAEHQFKSGLVYHWWHPLSEVGSPSRHSDDLLWLPYLVDFYIKETGDWDILKDSVAYIDDKKKDTLFAHCQKAIDFTLKRMSPRGLPLILEGDWNDGLSAMGSAGKGESIWLGHFLYGILTSFADISSRVNRTALSKKYIRCAEKLKTAINKYAWDGSWYIRGTFDNKKVMGSKKSKEGKIFLNAQTWAVINKTAVKDRGLTAMKSAEKYLMREYGPILFYPAFSKSDESIGYLSRYAPGVRENGGLYTHAGTWAVIAECMLGHGNKAWDIYKSMCPIDRAMNPDLYKAEPYVTSGNVDGPDSPNFGRGGWTWYTGSGAWMFRIATDWILGIRPEYDGLLVDPCIPSAWKGFSLTRTFRGIRYDIEVSNPKHVSQGIKSVHIDGKSIQGNLLPKKSSKKRHTVSVVMG
ncbi:glycosyl transferase family 36 [PVC group bacterium]|nr:glycosyl transferase family 36 [PVC group bacterium]